MSSVEWPWSTTMASAKLVSAHWPGMVVVPAVTVAVVPDGVGETTVTEYCVATVVVDTYTIEKDLKSVGFVYVVVPSMM